MRSLATFSLLISLTLSGVVSADESPFSIDLEFIAARNTNIGNAERSRDIVEDNLLTLVGGLSHSWEFGPQAVVVRGFLDTQRVDVVDGLSRLSFGGNLLYRRQITPQPTSPFLELGFTLRVDDFDVDQRDSTVSILHATISKALNTSINLSAGLEYQEQESEGTVWDLEQTRAFLGIDIIFAETWSVHGNYSFIDGEVASSAQTIFSDGIPADDIFELIDAAIAIEPDEAFNNAFPGTRWLAYSLSAVTNSFTIGVSKKLPHDFTLDFSYLSVFVDADSSNEYDVQVYRATLLKRF